MNRVDVRSVRRCLFGCLAIVAGGTLVGCKRDVLIAGDSSSGAGVGGAMAAGRGGNGGAAGATAAVEPRCDGPRLPPVALPGIQLAEDASDAVVGDWNHDGFPDLATVNSAHATISVVIGKGDGTFVSRTDYATGSGPVKIVTADLDRDGNPDLVTANGDDASASVLLGKGGGIFAARTDYAVGETPAVLLTGDWNRDGKLDFIAGDSFFAGKGDGTFARGQGYGFSPASLGTGDFDRDGRLDLIVQQDGSLMVALGRGDGTFSRSTSYPLDQYFVTMALGDLDADGAPDVVLMAECAKQTLGLYLFMGRTDGTFARSDVEPPSGSSAWFLCGPRIDIVDVNGDGKADLQRGPDQTMLGRGDGTFLPALASSPAASDALLGLADWNGDGRMDVAALDATSMLKVLPGKGDGTFGLVPLYQLADTLRDATLSDLDGDGNLDLITATYLNPLSVRRGNGDGTFAVGVDHPIAGNTTSIKVADLDGDGNPDLVTTRQSTDTSDNVNVITVNLAQGPGKYGAGEDYPTGLPMTSAIGDVDGDGKPDIVVFAYDSSAKLGVGGDVFSTFFNDGHGKFQRGSDVDAPREGGGGATFVDLNGDGRVDMLFDSQAGSSSSLMVVGDSNGRLAMDEDHSRDVSPVGFAAIGDLNRDGRVDLVAVDPAGAVLHVSLGAADGTFAPAIDSPTPSVVPGLGPPFAGGVALADVNGDGALDLVISTGEVVVQLGRGDGTFGCAEAYSTDTDESPLMFADLNHDGKLDAVDANGNAIVVLDAR